MNRQYLPTFAELIDRLSIVQLKAIFISENKEAYNTEMHAIKQDIDLLIKENDIFFTSKEIHAILMLMLSNRCIWESETKARAGGSEQDKLLKFTHSINGIRNNAKNVISQALGERVDLKIDCLAADLMKEFGNWEINY